MSPHRYGRDIRSLVVTMIKKPDEKNRKNKASRPLVVVSIRYSVLLKDNTQWIISRGQSDESYRSALFDDERLSLHYHLFSKLTLPSLLSQDPELDPDFFRLYVVTSEALPKKRKAEIVDLLKDIPWARVKEVPENAKGIPHSSHISEFIQEKTDGSAIYAHVRLDDDDALARDFVARISDYATEQNVGRVISLGRGVMANFDVDRREFVEFREMHYPKVAMGLTLIGKKKSPEDLTLPHVYSLGKHTKIDLMAPTILDSRSIAYIRTMHSLSDTQAQNTSGALDKIDIGIVRQHFTFL
nr:glycosyltransferase [Ancylobacter oerskovii]